MAKGQTAKIEVENIIRNAFGKNFLGVMDKKLYVLADDGGGEMINVAISMTCPKVPFSVELHGDNVILTSIDGDFTATGNFGQPDVFQPAEISTAEMENVHKLIKEFNL